MQQAIMIPGGFKIPNSTEIVTAPNIRLNIKAPNNENLTLLASKKKRSAARPRQKRKLMPPPSPVRTVGIYTREIEHLSHRSDFEQYQHSYLGMCHRLWCKLQMTNQNKGPPDIMIRILDTYPTYTEMLKTLNEMGLQPDIHNDIMQLYDYHCRVSKHSVRSPTQSNAIPNQSTLTAASTQCASLITPIHASLTVANLAQFSQQEALSIRDTETKSISSQGSTISISLQECSESFDFWIGNRWNTDAADDEIVTGRVLFDDYIAYCQKCKTYLKEIKAKIITRDKDKEFGKLLNYKFPGRRVSRLKDVARYKGFSLEDINSL